MQLSNGYYVPSQGGNAFVENTGRPTSYDICSLTIMELLALNVKIGEELRKRKVMRTANNPTGDYAEHLFCRTFGWEPTHRPDQKGYDATKEGVRYQIKARRLPQHKSSRQLSPIRDLHERPFEILACVLFNAGFSVMRAALIPVDLVIKRARPVERTNSHKFILSDVVWDLEGVDDVTDKVAKAARNYYR